jgi:hypothetical protein
MSNFSRACFLVALVAFAVLAPSGVASANTPGSVEWKTSDPKHEQRFNVGVSCAWSGPTMQVRMYISNKTNRSASIDITPRYHIKDGDWHGDSGSNDATVKLAAHRAKLFVVDGGNPEGVDGGPAIDRCRPQITAVTLGDAPLRVSSSSVASMIVEKLGRKTDYGLPRIRLALCVGRRICTIVINANTTVFSSERELLEGQRPLWKALFSDPKFRSGRITEWDKVTTVGGKNEQGRVLTLQCDRAAASQIDWDNVDSHGLKALCDYSPWVTFG